MSRNPEPGQKVSKKLQKRLIELISEEDCGGKKCSNAEFAKRTGVNKSVISNIANYGIIPSVRSLIKIADYLNVSLDYLLARSDDPTFERTDNPATFQERMSLLIEERKVKIADITNKGTFSRNSIHVWIKRNNLPSLEYAGQLAEYFEVSLDFLLGRTDYRN